MNLSQRIEQTSKCCTKKEQQFFDGVESAVQISQIFSDEKEIDMALDKIVQLARQLESEPCSIESKTTAVEQGILLEVNLQFCCQAEAVLFQMKYR
ncbi:DUF406 family protein [Pasteurellaceae bacterium 22721_9_1]